LFKKEKEIDFKFTEDKKIFQKKLIIMGIIIADLTNGGYLYKSSNDWNLLETATQSDSVDSTPSELITGVAYDGTTTYEIWRSYFSFDTTELIGASVSSITLNLNWSGGCKIAGLKSPKSLSTSLEDFHFDKSTFGSFYFDISTNNTFSSITLNNDAIIDAGTGELNIVLLEYIKDYSSGTFSVAALADKNTYYTVPSKYPYLEFTLEGQVDKVNGISNFSLFNILNSSKIDNIGNSTTIYYFRFTECCGGQTYRFYSYLPAAFYDFVPGEVTQVYGQTGYPFPSPSLKGCLTFVSESLTPGTFSHILLDGNYSFTSPRTAGQCLLENPYC
jgi:hypothetical protein